MTCIPGDVQKALRSEVGFVCPYPDCGSPYLTFHHFDPAYHEEAHYRPEGMVALCREHHGFADQGHYSDDQLREWKQTPQGVIDTKAQKLAWLKREPIVLIGSVFTRYVPLLFEFRGQKSLWISTDDSGYALLNLSMEAFTDSPMVVLRDNCWQYNDLPVDVVCPPGGKRLKVTYRTGDYLDLVYDVYDDQKAIQRKHLALSGEECDFFEVSFPATVLTVKGRFGGGQLALMPSGLKLRGDKQRMVIVGLHGDQCGSIMNLDLSRSVNTVLKNSFYKHSTGPILRVS